MSPWGARRFLGQFGNETVRLSLTGLPEHQALTLSFDLFVIRTWDGNGPPGCCGPDIWRLRADGTSLLQTTFSTTGNRQAYPGGYPGGDNPPRTGAVANDVLGYSFGASGSVDSLYRITRTVSHSSSTLTLEFSAQGLQALTDESWGLDNVAVMLSANDSTTVEEAGWFAADQWLWLGPLGNGCHCGACGPGTMLLNWFAPYSIGDESPRAGDVWNVAFGTAISTGWFGPGGTPVWRRLTDFWPGQGEAMVDLRKAAEQNGLRWEHVMAAAVTYVELRGASPRELWICLGHDDSAQVWVNDQLVANQSACTGSSTSCQQRERAVLLPGLNAIKVLVWNGEADWGFRLRLEDRAGEPVTEGHPDFVFRGPDPGGTAGEVTYRATRHVSLACEGDGSSSVVVRTTAGGDPADRVQVTELLGSGNPFTVEAISDGGTFTRIPSESPVGGDRAGILEDQRSINAPCLPGHLWYDPTRDSYTLACNGLDIWEAGDQFHFAYRRVTGDFDLTARIRRRAWIPGSRWGKVGLMARQSLDYRSRYAFVHDSGEAPQDQTRFAGRVTHGGGASGDNFESSSLEPGSHPQWLRLVRAGNVFSGMTSENGIDWEEQCAMDWGDETPRTVLVGLGGSASGWGCYGTPGHIPAYVLMEFDGVRLTTPLGPQGSPEAFSGRIDWNLSRSLLNSRGVSYAVRGSRPIVARGLVGAATTTGGEVIESPRVIDPGPLGAFERAVQIGASYSLGSASHDVGRGEYTLSGRGKDIWQGGDQFTFVYRRLEGDFRFQARIRERRFAQGRWVTWSGAPGDARGSRWGKIGLMARQDCSGRSRYAFVFDSQDSPDGTVDPARFGARLAHGGMDNYEVLMPQGGQGYPHPDWLRLDRRGTRFTAYVSSDGGSWTTVSSSDWGPDAPPAVLVGLAVLGHVTAGCEGTSATFDSVSIAERLVPDLVVSEVRSPPSIPAGDQLPVDITVTNVGTPVPVGSTLGATVADGFDFPVGPPTKTPAYDGDGWYVYQGFQDAADPWGKTLPGTHLGEDWNREGHAEADFGKPVHVVANGIVLYAQDTEIPDWLGVVMVRHDAPAGRAFVLPGGGTAPAVVSLYGHLDPRSISALKDQTVARGQQIGTIGATPRGSSGPHLHLEIRSDVALGLGPGYSTNPAGWLAPTEFIAANRRITLPASSHTRLRVMLARGPDINVDVRPAADLLIPNRDLTTGSITRRVSLPVPLAFEGNYYVGAYIDAGFQVREWSETNNAASGATQVSVTRPLAEAQVSSNVAGIRYALFGAMDHYGSLGQAGGQAPGGAGAEASQVVQVIPGLYLVQAEPVAGYASPAAFVATIPSGAQTRIALEYLPDAARKAMWVKVTVAGKLAGSTTTPYGVDIHVDGLSGPLHVSASDLDPGTGMSKSPLQGHLFGREDQVRCAAVVAFTRSAKRQPAAGFPGFEDLAEIWLYDDNQIRSDGTWTQVGGGVGSKPGLRKISQEEWAAGTLDLTLAHPVFRWNLFCIAEDSIPYDELVRVWKPRFERASEVLFLATDGQCLLGKVWILPAKKQAGAFLYPDLRIKKGNSVPASLPFDAFRARDGAIEVSTKFDEGKPVSYHATSIVHELGHYIFSFEDEYKSACGECLSLWGLARDCDPRLYFRSYGLMQCCTTIPTIWTTTTEERFNRQRYWELSIDADYGKWFDKSHEQTVTVDREDTTMQFWLSAEDWCKDGNCTCFRQGKRAGWPQARDSLFKQNDQRHRSCWGWLEVFLEFFMTHLGSDAIDLSSPRVWEVDVKTPMNLSWGASRQEPAGYTVPERHGRLNVHISREFPSGAGAGLGGRVPAGRQDPLPGGGANVLPVPELLGAEPGTEPGSVQVSWREPTVPDPAVPRGAFRVAIAYDLEPFPEGAFEELTRLEVSLETEEGQVRSTTLFPAGSFRESFFFALRLVGPDGQ
ncbi:MAG: peptidoglycan DD-metalloendopeptidase family protein, partial [Planctomycetes bacterium]|nr:peptidoglycan DD-metalloendopeptidase family protein [Planctomycetota bacterium]